MQIYECMTPNVRACVPEDSCAVAGKIMRRRGCGFLPVVDSLATRRVTGVVTDRAIMLHLIHRNVPASEVSVKACMTGVPTMISPDADLEVAIRVMKKEAVDRLPVIAQGRLVGVLSLQDIVLAAHRQWAYVGPHVTEQSVTEILEAMAIALERSKERSRLALAHGRKRAGERNGRSIR